MDTLGATPALVPPSDECPPIYHPRNPRASPLFQLFETHYETVKSVWEERFERRYGFWRGLYDTTVARYLDCGLLETLGARSTTPLAASTMTRMASSTTPG